MKLTPEQYWKWRTLIAHMWNSENKEGARKWQLQSMNNEAVIASLKAQVFKLKDVKAATNEKDAAQAEYQEYKKHLEEELGISLNGVTIDDVTLEVRSMEGDD